MLATTGTIKKENKLLSNEKPHRSNVDSNWQRLAKARTEPPHGLAELAPTYRM